MLSLTRAILFCAAVATSAGAPAVAAAAPHRVHIWLRGFIPSPTAPAPASYRQANGQWLIVAPDPLSIPSAIGLPSGCFSTDNRTFSTSDAPNISARVTFEADVVLQDGEMRLEKHNNLDFARIGLTRNVDCRTGADLQPPRRAPATSVTVGSVRTAPDGLRKVVNIRGSTGDPFYQVAGLPFAPKLDFELVMTFDPTLGRLEVQGVAGTFPAFEVYYQLDGGATQKIIQWAPTPNAGAASLADLWIGLNSRNFSHQIPTP